MSVILFTGEGVSASVHAGIHTQPSRYTPQADTRPSRYPPPEQAHPLAGTPPGGYTPRLVPPGWYSPGKYPLVGTPPCQVHPPQQSLQWTVCILLECFLVVTVTMQMGERKMYYLRVDHSQNVGQVQGRMRKPSDPHVFVQV